MRAYGAFTRRMSGCVRRSPSRRPRAARPKTVGDRCGPRVDRHQSKRQTRTAFRLPDATRDSFHEDDTPGAMRSERRKETRARCACEASNAPTMRVHRAGAASGLDQRAQRAKAISECNERMQRAGRVCGCGERQDGSGIEAQCATATRTPRCRRPASVDRAGPIPTRRAAALRRDRARPFRSARTAARRLPSHRAAHAAATPIGHERRCAPARAPHSRRRAERRRASNRPTSGGHTINRSTHQSPHDRPRSAHDRLTTDRHDRQASDRHARSCIRSPAAATANARTLPPTDAACAPRVGRTGRRAVMPPDTARASAHTARAASTARDRHRARAPRDTASAGRPDARGRPSRDRAAPR
ncbi:Uncharacterised protein [Burkholderia pseudomallei]|nr:xenobiotic reductase A domain protein [Burkholderia pseudomallei]CAJ2729337.1 xenobiotic reductase A domain protein [Burkholderia pseudomallei]CAJ2743200.1 xenobiotic reductase A domain protein [Burkholderia pseudomallei]CAJ2745554.1 xenobiotic reductase A domain protein [Burkholderia pseudomallei]CAJ2745711.1 xenobiotic reductase A domain protein [Burkholderia pseudomallei]